MQHIAEVDIKPFLSEHFLEHFISLLYYILVYETELSEFSSHLWLREPHRQDFCVPVCRRRKRLWRSQTSPLTWSAGDADGDAAFVCRRR